jgi:hypothetical protein
MLVEVTQEDIDRGRRLHGTACPVSLALSRAVGRTVSVNGYECRIWHPLRDNRDYVELPVDVTKRIETFDSTGAMTPFSFVISQLPIPQSEQNETLP